MNLAVKRRAGRAVTKLLGRLGYDVVPAWRVAGRPFAEYLAKMFLTFEIDCVFDVGANHGDYGSFLRHEVGYRGLILSFEPVAKTAEACRAAAAGDAAWRVFPVGLGDTEQNATINIAASDKLTSLLSPLQQAPGGLSSMIAVQRTETVAITRLDSLLPSLRAELGFRRPYLKTDTQGYDLAVFRGAGALLEEFQALQTELSIQPLYEGMPDWRVVLDELGSHRFAIGNIFPVNIDAWGRAVEFDCVMINDRHVAAEIRGDAAA